ncbi:zf-TFIIB domain-containing protein [Defluviimonas sp. WL0024]|uniref:Zf-TFIIB domain-containing protein n=1 Tax=Albidovulum salinarum TaxID=2984153 RepID=A0ABT2X561_9RHOB|nr:zf-TFIIB domain-containing protein [Defluviimonas sp. WL0024]MCU9849076.1 zf-TFIIB domain-containing protein [Defluviimonas sp. WL0024]
MKCPACTTTLTMTERSGVEIDYCPNCRGVWLDRGELDKIIDRTVVAAAPAVALSEPQRQVARDEDRRYRDDDDDRRYHKKKRESFLSELFDF